MGGAPLGDDNVAGLLDDGDAVRVEQLPVSLPALAELKLETALAVEDLQINGFDGVTRDWDDLRREA